MRTGSKISTVAEFKVLNKYKIKILSISSFEITKSYVSFYQPKLFLVMELGAFKEYFPHVISLLLFKKLFSNETFLKSEDFRRYLPLRSYYKFYTPVIEQIGDYVSFQDKPGDVNRKKFAGWLHSIEALEVALKRQKFKVEIEEE